MVSLVLIRFTSSTICFVSTCSNSPSSDSGSGDGGCLCGDSPLMKTASSLSDSDSDGGVGVCPSGDGDSSPPSLRCSIKQEEKM